MIKSLAVAAIAAATIFFPSPKKASIPSTTLSNEGNGFLVSERLYGEDESFVYTATVNFHSGQAAGLAIGAAENDHYFVFNIDRYENRTKLLYFVEENGNVNAREYRSEYLIGNDKVTESELAVIKPKVAACPEFHLKVVVTVEEEHAYAEFYIDNIKRFGVDSSIDLNALDGYSYQGGNLGYNVFASNVTFDEITAGKSDYSYYTEAYRNQYHYSQYAHWNNDPNGLVYYKGYYHMYYQTHPYTKYWDHMYWGHARSRDLVHWEELPYALFPDDGNMGVGLGVGYAWSGIAMVYHPGMSGEIDGQNWFPNGNGTGLLGYYTRDGMRQDQVVISSDDEGMTWTKRTIIPQSIATGDIGKVDCRDPSIFSLRQDGENRTTLWGMLLSGGTQNRFWFLKSSDMLHWEYAGGYDYVYPECMSVYSLKTQYGTPYHAISVSSRYYAVGHLGYNDMSGEIYFTLPDGYDYSRVGQKAFKKMDYAEDSYAAQAFSIDDAASEYYGKTVAVSWYSGLPSDAESGIYADVRNPWNGGGMTIPVELGLIDEGSEITLTQTPITKSNENFEKTNLVSASDISVSKDNNLLDEVNTHTFELSASIDNPNRESVEFRVACSEDEYTAFGWNSRDGYYFDRTHTSTGGIEFHKNYSHKFTSGKGNGESLSFYALCDNGGLEIFVDDFRYAFYGLTLAAPYSIGASFLTSGEVTVNSLEVNKIASIWHKDEELEEGVLYLDQNDIELDLSLYDRKDVLVYSTNHEEITYELVSGEGIVEFEPTSKGLRIRALNNGVAEILAKTESEAKSIFVTVDEAEIDCDLSLTKDGIKSGVWRKSSAGLIGLMSSGDGYYLGNESIADFQYGASFSLSAVAAGLVVRANEDLSQFVVCNIDANEHIVKVFSHRGELGRAHVELDSLENINYAISAVGQELDILVNDQKALHVTLPDDIPEEGFLGLNVFNGSATFQEVNLTKLGYEFLGEDLAVENAGGQYIRAIFNQTEKNSLVNPAYYRRDGQTLILSKDYLSRLKANKTYRFYAEGEDYSFGFTVSILEEETTLEVEDRTLREGLDVLIRIGRFEVASISINGAVIDSNLYSIKDYCLRIDHSVFSLGENRVILNNTVSFKVNVTPLQIEAGTNMALGQSQSETPTLSLYAALIPASIALLLLVGTALAKRKGGIQ